MIRHITVYGTTLPQVWERAVLALVDEGESIPTQYDKFGDPPSLDAMVTVVAMNPLMEPRIHKNIPSGIEGLVVYVREVLDGIHDHWIDPQHGKWSYTYHERLRTHWRDQITAMTRMLAECPHTRRAQATTWDPTVDLEHSDPPCLQRIWARIHDSRLDFHVSWRSRDLWKAWFMNAYALTELQIRMAANISHLRGEIIRVGQYIDTSDSLHIYGSDQGERFRAEVEKMRVPGSYLQRSWITTEVQDIMDEAQSKLDGDPDFFAKGGSL